MDLINIIKNTFKMYKTDETSFKYIDKKVSWVPVFFIAWVLVTIQSLLMLGMEDTSWINIIVYPFSVLVLSGVLYMFLRLLKGKAGFKDTLKFGLSLAIPAGIFSVVIAAIYLAASYSQTSIIIGSILSFLFSIWVIIASLYAYSYLHKISKLRVFGAFALSLLVFIVFFIAIFLIIIAILISAGVVPAAA